ncbi:hypothetical protein HDU67_004713 [Dinochytrium kinnereticum]|nr:hypothetical protein HDU67_004713 [Dinochytrium kinnereticum]
MADRASRLPPYRIAIVEDNKINVLVLKRMLEHFMGHKVPASDVFDDGAQFLSALCSQRFDLVLMDIEMPVMNGCDATIRIRKGTPSSSTTTTTAPSPTVSHHNQRVRPNAQRPSSLSSLNPWAAERYPSPTPSPSPASTSTTSTHPVHRSSTPTPTPTTASSSSPITPSPLPEDYAVLEENRNIPIIAVTSLSSEVERLYYLSIGMDEVINKPISRPDLLVQYVRRFLSEGRPSVGGVSAGAGAAGETGGEDEKKASVGSFDEEDLMMVDRSEGGLASPPRERRTLPTVLGGPLPSSSFSVGRETESAKMRRPLVQGALESALTGASALGAHRPIPSPSSSHSLLGPAFQHHPVALPGPSSFSSSSITPTTTEFDTVPPLRSFSSPATLANRCSSSSTGAQYGQQQQHHHHGNQLYYPHPLHPHHPHHHSHHSHHPHHHFSHHPHHAFHHPPSLPSSPSPPPPPPSLSTSSSVTFAHRRFQTSPPATLLGGAAHTPPTSPPFLPGVMVGGEGDAGGPVASLSSSVLGWRRE